MPPTHALADGASLRLINDVGTAVWTLSAGSGVGIWQTASVTLNSEHFRFEYIWGGKRSEHAAIAQVCILCAMRHTYPPSPTPLS